MSDQIFRNEYVQTDVTQHDIIHKVINVVILKAFTSFKQNTPEIIFISFQWDQHLSIFRNTVYSILQTVNIIYIYISKWNYDYCNIAS